MFILFMAVISSIKNDFYVLPFCKGGGTFSLGLVPVPILYGKVESMENKYEIIGGGTGGGVGLAPPPPLVFFAKLLITIKITFFFACQDL